MTGPVRVVDAHPACSQERDLLVQSDGWLVEIHFSELTNK